MAVVLLLILCHFPVARACVYLLLNYGAQTERRIEEEEDVFWKKIRRSDPKPLREHDVILKNTPSGTYLV